MTTAAPWLDLEPVLCPWCDGPCTEEPELIADEPEENDRG